MPDPTIEIEAETLEEAREQVKDRIPKGFSFLSDRALADGKPQTLSAYADTTEAAFVKAQNELPPDAEILSKKELAAPEPTILTVEAFDEEAAKKIARMDAALPRAGVKGIRLAAAGRRGVFGIGARRHQYEVELWKPASVQITYRTKAKVLVQLLDHSKCMICQEPLQFESRTGLGIFFGDQLFDQMLRTAYKCRECGAPICMEHARTSRCRRCGGNTFDRALKEDTKTDEDVIEELRGTFPEAAEQLTEAWAREAVDQLVEIYRQNPEGFIVGHKGPAVQELRRIGQMLHSRGGFDLMRAAHFLFRHKTRGIPGAPRNLEHMWDGIGPWLG